MKKFCLILLCYFLFQNGFSQIRWYRDIKNAQEVAMLNNKLMVIDFWAEWCGPCKLMEYGLWILPKMAGISGNFIPVRIDIDDDVKTAFQYKVAGIPKVVIATATGEVLWEKVGWFTANDYLPVLESIPSNVGDLNKTLQLLKKEPKNADYLLQLGMDYQNAGKKIAGTPLRDAFLDNSSQAFNKSQKEMTDPAVSLKAELLTILNDVYHGKSKATLKKMSKIETDTSNDELAELKHFIIASCYKLDKDEENLLKAKEKITNAAYLAELDE